MEEQTVNITQYSKRGLGLTGSPRPIEIPGTFIGETVKIVKKKKKHKKILQADVLEIIQKSQDRVSAKCPHVKDCGGCTWQELSYKTQLAEKQKIIQRLFPEHQVDPVVSMPDPWFYRGKMEFSFSQDKKKQKYLGLHKRNGRGRIEDLSTCYIAPPFVEVLLASVKAWWEESNLLAYYPEKDTGSLRTLTVRYSQKTGCKLIYLTVSGNLDYIVSKKHLESFCKAVSLDEKTSIFLVIQRAKKGHPTQFDEIHLQGPTKMQENLLGKDFFISPRSFFQPNPLMAEKMFSCVIEQLKLQGNERVLDLFCGMGTIGILLSSYVRQVIGVETELYSVIDAKDNIENLDINNVDIYHQDVFQFFAENASFCKPDILLVDPPRCGLGDKTIEHIKQLYPKKMVYVSCNPETQKEDIQKLSTHFSIEKIIPFDAFCHTPHIENIIFLTYNKSL